MNEGLNLATFQQGDWGAVLNYPSGEDAQSLAASLRSGSRRFWKARGKDEDAWTMRQAIRIDAVARQAQNKAAVAKEPATGRRKPVRKCKA